MRPSIRTGSLTVIAGAAIAGAVLTAGSRGGVGALPPVQDAFVTAMSVATQVLVPPHASAGHPPTAAEVSLMLSRGRARLARVFTGEALAGELAALSAAAVAEAQGRRQVLGAALRSVRFLAAHAHGATASIRARLSGYERVPELVAGRRVVVRRWVSTTVVATLVHRHRRWLVTTLASV